MDNHYKILLKVEFKKDEVAYIVRVFPKNGTFTIPFEVTTILDAWMVK